MRSDVLVNAQTHALVQKSRKSCKLEVKGIESGDSCAVGLEEDFLIPE